MPEKIIHPVGKCLLVLCSVKPQHCLTGKNSMAANNSHCTALDSTVCCGQSHRLLQIVWSALALAPQEAEAVARLNESAERSHRPRPGSVHSSSGADARLQSRPTAVTVIHYNNTQSLRCTANQGTFALAAHPIAVQGEAIQLDL